MVQMLFWGSLSLYATNTLVAQTHSLEEFWLYSLNQQVSVLSHLQGHFQNGWKRILYELCNMTNHLPPDESTTKGSATSTAISAYKLPFKNHCWCYKEEFKDVKKNNIEFFYPMYHFYYQCYWGHNIGYSNSYSFLCHSHVFKRCENIWYSISCSWCCGSEPFAPSS